jgi:hypothetical protein
VRRANRVLIAVVVVGVVLVAVGLIVGTPTPSVEGAYFDRANGSPAFAGVFSASKPTLLDPADGNLWIGAGIALLLAVSTTLLWRVFSKT